MLWATPRALAYLWDVKALLPDARGHKHIHVAFSELLQAGSATQRSQHNARIQQQEQEQRAPCATKEQDLLHACAAAVHWQRLPGPNSSRDQNTSRNQSRDPTAAETKKHPGIKAESLKQQGPKKHPGTKAGTLQQQGLKKHPGTKKHPETKARTKRYSGTKARTKKVSRDQSQDWEVSWNQSQDPEAVGTQKASSDQIEDQKASRDKARSKQQQEPKATREQSRDPKADNILRTK